MHPAPYDAPPTPFERGHQSAHHQLDQLAGVVDVDDRATVAAHLLEQLTFHGDPSADPVRADFDAGYRQALLDAIEEANVIRCAHCGTDQHAVADLNIARGYCCAITLSGTIAADDAVTDVGTALHLTHRVLADIIPATISELLDVADLVIDAGRGALAIVTTVTA